MSLDVYLVTTDLTSGDDTVFGSNITHNLNTMADNVVVMPEMNVTLYRVLWRPEELGINLAMVLEPMLEKGLEELLANPEYYKTFNPANGWGTYDGLVVFVQDYISACRSFPTARIQVSR